MGQRTYEAGELTRSELLQRNEQIKGLSGLCVTIGTALFIAGAGRWFHATVDVYTMLWLLIGPIVVWTGLHVLALSEH